MVNEKELTRQIQKLFPTITLEDEYRQLLLASVFFKESVMELHFEVIGGMVTSTDLHKIAEHIKEATGWSTTTYGGSPLYLKPTNQNSWLY